MYNERISAVKNRLGRDLAILAHHYQSDAIVEHADLVGDSLQLSAAISGLEARFIVFCGVDFMAETAAVLAARQQMIFSPDPGATCVMADMAPDYLVRRILEKISLSGKVIPLSYVNSSLGVKAVCGEYGGSVCTSSNASMMLDWAFKQGDRVLFLPDMNLGRNIAGLSGLDPADIHILDIRSGGENIRVHDLEDKRLLLWPGVCAVHFRIKKENVMSIRRDNPEALMVVHPESHPEVVSLADAAGSTSKIISFTRNAPPGSRVFIGTEDNLVFRLRKRYPDKDILPLGAGYCSNMARITPKLLARCLENLTPENAVRVAPGLAQSAHKAVDTMLEVSSQ